MKMRYAIKISNEKEYNIFVDYIYNPVGLKYENYIIGIKKYVVTWFYLNEDETYYGFDYDQIKIPKDRFDNYYKIVTNTKFHKILNRENKFKRILKNG